MHTLHQSPASVLLPSSPSCGDAPRQASKRSALLVWAALGLAGPSLATDVAWSGTGLTGGPNAAEAAWIEPYHEHGAAHAPTAKAIASAESTPLASTPNDVDELLDAVDLLDPDLSPELVLEVLGEMLGEPASKQDRGGASATGYTAHRKWGVGGANGYGLDQFGGSALGTYRARAAVRLDNGHVVVVGDIQGSGVSAVRNLGMVKFNSRGQRVIWTDVGNDFNQSSGNYIKFPGTNSWGLNREVFSVHDVRVSGSFLYVLITSSESGVRRPVIIRWGLNGSGYSWWFSNPPDDAGNVRDAVAMDILGNQMIVLARRSTSTLTLDGGFWTTRWTIEANGALTLGERTVFLAGDRRVPADVAFRRNLQGIMPLSPPYYVAYTFNNGTTSTSPHRPCITRIAANNTIDTNFGMAGLDCRPFGDGGNEVDRAVALHTRSIGTPLNPGEAMYLAVDVDRNLARGTGLVKFIDGAVTPSFGPGGRRLYGGCASLDPVVGEGCSSLAPLIQHTSHTPLAGALFANATGVYVAGHTFRAPGSLSSVPTRRPVFLHVSESDGALQSLQQFGSYPNSQFAALVPRPGSSEFTVVGFASDEDTTSINTGPKRFLSAHLVRNSELIFYDGLQTQP